MRYSIQLIRLAKVNAGSLALIRTTCLVHRVCMCYFGPYPEISAPETLDPKPESEARNPRSRTQSHQSFSGYCQAKPESRNI